MFDKYVLTGGDIDTDVNYGDCYGVVDGETVQRNILETIQEFRGMRNINIDEDGIITVHFENASWERYYPLAKREE